MPPERSSRDEWDDRADSTLELFAGVEVIAFS